MVDAFVSRGGKPDPDTLNAALKGAAMRNKPDVVKLFLEKVLISIVGIIVHGACPLGTCSRRSRRGYDIARARS